jgi:hypothetical protein
MTATTTTGTAVRTSVPFMEPVLRRGRSALDRGLLPGDENEARLAALLEGAAERGLDGVVLFGAAHLPENLVYYANYPPTTFHGAVVARAGEPPTLFAGKGGARDHPYIRTVSWVADIRYAADYGQAILDVTDAWGPGTGRLGVAGLDITLPHHVREGVLEALGDRIVAVDDLVAQQRRRKSAREIAVLRRARDLAVHAAAAAVAAAEGGAGRRTALAAADYAARAGGAHDCRITAGTEQGGVATMSEVTDAAGPVRAVVAVEYLGYWGLAGLRVGGEAGDPSGLDRILSCLRPGGSAEDAIALESADARDSYVVNGIGCAPAEGPAWGEGLPMVEGDVLTVVRSRRGGNGLEFDVRTVLVTPEGARDL